MDTATEYENRILAFVDILGFAAIVSRLASDPELHRTLNYALSRIGSYKKTSEMSNTAHSNLEVSVFSDSIVVSAVEGRLDEVVWACGWLQAELLGAGILTRGGISVGKTIHSKDLLYGEGMLKAYRIESSAAVYPRIVIDPVLITDKERKLCAMLLEADLDELWFIDPYAFGATAGNADALLEDGYDPHEVYLEVVQKHIDQGIENVRQVDHLAKWSWLKKRHETAHKNYLRTRKTRLWSTD